MGIFGNSWDIICTKECVYKEEYDNIKKIDFDIKSNELETKNFITKNDFDKNYDLIIIDTYNKYAKDILESNLFNYLLYNDILVSYFYELNAAIIGGIYLDYVKKEDLNNIDDKDFELETEDEDYELLHNLDFYDLSDFYDNEEYFRKMIDSNNNLFSWKYIPKENREKMYQFLSDNSLLKLNKQIDEKRILLIDAANEKYINKYNISHSAINFLNTYTYNTVEIIKLI